MDAKTLTEYRYHRANGGTAQGSLHCARLRAMLDAAIEAGAVEVRWQYEDERYEDVIGFDDDAERDRFYRDIESNAITGPYWCALYVDGDVAASLGMVTLGPRDVCGDYYARLVEVELAGEAEDEIRQALGDARDREQLADLLDALGAYLGKTPNA